MTGLVMGQTSQSLLVYFAAKGPCFYTQYKFLRVQENRSLLQYPRKAPVSSGSDETGPRLELLVTGSGQGSSGDSAQGQLATDRRLNSAARTISLDLHRLRAT